MRDLAGFAILVVVLLASIYLIGDVVVPLLLRYVFGVFAFFVVATVLVLKGRQHPAHLESLLKPGVAPALTVLAVLIPLAHSLVAWLAGAVEDWWVLFIVNGSFPILWTVRLLIAHRHQKVLYVAQGHDIEDLLDLARRREATLEVLDDALASAADRSPEPEAWEREVGLGPLVGPGDPEAIRRTRERIAELRERLRALAETLAHALAEVQGQDADGPQHPRTTGAHPVVPRTRDALVVLDGPLEETRRQATRLLAEVSSGTGIPGWEEVR